MWSVIRIGEVEVNIFNLYISPRLSEDEIQEILNIPSYAIQNEIAH